MAESTKTGSEEFGDLLRCARERLGMSRRDLAEASGLSYPYISQLETGYRMPSSPAMRSLADALGLRVDSLFDAIPPAAPRDAAPPPPPSPAALRAPAPASAAAPAAPAAHRVMPVASPAGALRAAALQAVRPMQRLRASPPAPRPLGVAGSRTSATCRPPPVPRQERMPRRGSTPCRRGWPRPASRVATLSSTRRPRCWIRCRSAIDSPRSARSRVAWCDRSSRTGSGMPARRISRPTRSSPHRISAPAHRSGAVCGRGEPVRWGRGADRRCRAADAPTEP